MSRTRPTQAPPIVADGMIRTHMLDFLEELTTFHVAGSTAAARIGALTRFGKLVLGKLSDVYASRMLPASPF